MRRARLLTTTCLTASMIISAGGASADDKDQYNLFNPTPVDKMRAFNTDRPAKSNVPYTVDAGHFQYEGDLFIYTYDNTSTADTQITGWTVGNPTFKLGLLNNVDFEVNFSFYNSIRTVGVSTGTSSVSQGFGDTFTRFKWNLFGNEGDGPAFALIPYAKWPTAPVSPTGTGNGYIEGGLIAPLAVPLPLGFTAILMGEMDIVKNSFDSNYRVNIPALININRTIFENVTAYAEIYANWSTNPQAPNIYTADFALAWQPRPNFQLDVGINIGLNPAAPPYQIYMGIAQRF
ncbi:MAG: transporter [Reyranella sp.]|nr:transporter [Reyranella sp.]MBL6652679.1 transporter [Reyranella sp.]